MTPKRFRHADCLDSAVEDVLAAVPLDMRKHRCTDMYIDMCMEICIGVGIDVCMGICMAFV